MIKHVNVDLVIEMDEKNRDVKESCPYYNVRSIHEKEKRVDEVSLHEIS